MKRRRAAGALSQKLASAGYTITEVIIVMAVTGTLFASVAYMLSGRQAATQFTQALRDYESKIQSIASDVSSGYYVTGSYNCLPGAPGSQVTFNATAPFKDPGTNRDCIFLGKMVTVGTLKSEVFTLVGRQFKGNVTSGDVELLSEAKPAAVSTPAIDITEEYEHKYGLEVRNMYIVGTTTSIGGFGFISELGGGAGSANPVSGGRSVLLYRLAGTTTPNDRPKATNVNTINTTANLLDADEGVRICFTDGGSKRGEITIGADASQTGTNVTEGTGVSPECS